MEKADIYLIIVLCFAVPLVIGYIIDIKVLYSSTLFGLGTFAGFVLGGWLCVASSVVLLANNVQAS